jgi:hypothetical protein
MTENKKQKSLEEKISENDIYQSVNVNGDLAGCFFNKCPIRAGRKIAKKIYLEMSDNKNKDFNMKIYNKSKDKYYNYKVVIKDVNKTKNINGKEIKITEDIILTKI